jgi:(1->4)-alpha-D-glucan 1-alpha-D-glucosylmutase
LRKAAERPEVKAAIREAIARFNGQPGVFESWNALNLLIEIQNWRLAHFMVAGDDINYRRFFNVNDLAGIRMELPDVFDHAHQLVVRLLDNGTLDGIRIDHIDGLLDPKAYLTRLREIGGDSFYLVVEKILAHHESLREDWQIQGTTGYEFTNLLLAVIVDPAGESEFDRLYSEFTRQTRSFAEIVRECKLGIMANEMASELHMLALGAARIARQNPRTSDFTANILHRAIREIVASFPVYRTYIDANGQLTDADMRDLDWALSIARRTEASIDPSVFDFVAKLLSGSLVAEPRSGFARHSVLRCAMNFQQYSGPVMAKGLEDTAFYRYNRLIALNEVGGHPDRFGLQVTAFHKANVERARKWPNSMLSSSTHDTKRGEDVRARLAALSEIPEEWEQKVKTWSRILRARRADADGTSPPDRNDEYAFYQLLLGSWPVELLVGPVLDRDILAAYAERIKAALTKSMREAKVHSTWAAPNEAYEGAMLAFADIALDPHRSAAFMAAFLPFAERVARFGAENTLLQTVLKFTVPGIPDIYQGAEFWDLSLVDPDNRRPPDFAARKNALEEVRPIISLPDTWKDGKFKLSAIHTLLTLRQRHPDLFSGGSYEELQVEGAHADEVIAFMRRSEGTSLLVVAVRFPARRSARGGIIDAQVQMPDTLTDAVWRDVSADRRVTTFHVTDLVLGHAAGVFLSA